MIRVIDQVHTRQAIGRHWRTARAGDSRGVASPPHAPQCRARAPVIDEIIAGVTKRGAEFDRVEIETISRCNNTCAFCPVNRHVDPPPALL